MSHDPPPIKIKEEEVPATEALKLRVEMWKKTVDVQEHFNDIALRLRSIAITVLVGALGAAFYVAKDAGYGVSLGIVIMGAIGWSAFFLMDRYWYHIFLRASGIHAGETEKRLMAVLPEIGLATAISKASQNVEIPAWPSKHPVYKGGTYSSAERLVLFYKLGFVVLGIAAAVVVLLAVLPHVRRVIQPLTQVEETRPAQPAAPPSRPSAPPKP